jgi:hypothetical protein
VSLLELICCVLVAKMPRHFDFVFSTSGISKHVSCFYCEDLCPDAELYFVLA